MNDINTKPGEVKLHYFGHAAFMWTSPSGQRILIDPYGDPHETSRLFPSYGKPASRRWFKAPFPRTECDVVLITHPHFDHDAVERVAGLPTIVRSPLALVDKSNVRIRGFMGKHAGSYGKEFNQHNVIFVLDIAGVTFCHIGDNQAELPAQMLQAIDQVDVLMVTVDDSNHLLSYAEVAQVIARLKPAVVIPMHYLIPQLTDAESTLKGIEQWLSEQVNLRYLNTRQVTFSSTTLPKKQEIWVMDAGAQVS